MSKPERTAFKEPTLEEKQTLSDGTIYEHWHDRIDNYHHLHLPSGILIVFEHEDCEGSVKFFTKEGGKL